MSKKVFVVGGDGFCGWPTALKLSEEGHAVTIIDNLSRRKIDVELGVDSLTPIATIFERLNTWNGSHNNKISFEQKSFKSDFTFLRQIFDTTFVEFIKYPLSIEKC